MTELLQALERALGSDIVLLGDAIPDRNRQDASNIAPTTPLALLRPRTTQHVSAALAICHEWGQPVVTQGGMTGLAGGAHPGSGEIALSLERTCGIEEIDTVASTMTVLAGTPLSVIQDAASAAGLACGIDLGARGSCTIGGAVATNAGGNQVVRYGMTRRNVLGLEAVLADGTVVSSLNKMMKNNTCNYPQIADPEFEGICVEGIGRDSLAGTESHWRGAPWKNRHRKAYHGSMASWRDRNSETSGWANG